MALLLETWEGNAPCLLHFTAPWLIAVKDPFVITCRWVEEWVVCLLTRHESNQLCCGLLRGKEKAKEGRERVKKEGKKVSCGVGGVGKYGTRRYDVSLCNDRCLGMKHA